MGGFITDGEKTITEEEIVSTLKVPSGYLEVISYGLPYIGFRYTTESEEEIIVRFYQNFCINLLNEITIIICLSYLTSSLIFKVPLVW